MTAKCLCMYLFGPLRAKCLRPWSFVFRPHSPPTASWRALFKQWTRASCVHFAFVCIDVIHMSNSDVHCCSFSSLSVLSLYLHLYLFCLSVSLLVWVSFWKYAGSKQFFSFFLHVDIFDSRFHREENVVGYCKLG